MSEITVETALQEMERRLNRARPPWRDEPEVHDQLDDVINGLDETQAVLPLDDDTQTVAAARIAVASRSVVASPRRTMAATPASFSRTAIRPS